MSPIPIFIPVVNRFDLAKKAIESCECARMQAFCGIIDNSPDQSWLNPQWVPSVPLTFAQTQNWMLKIASKYPFESAFYIFLHSDAEAEGDTVLRLIAMARAMTTQGKKWGCIFSNYDALAAFNTEAMTAIGGWDTMLEWYASDCDCYRRLRLAGYPTLESGLPVKHEPSQTLKADPLVKRRVDLTVPFRAAYYRAKWGGDPGSELFSQPFQGVLS